MTLNSEVKPEAAGRVIDRSPRAEDQQPASASEKYLAALWKEIIGLDRVMLPDKFLDVGGNSLTLNIIVTRVAAETGAALEPLLFFDDSRSSLFELAKELDAALAKLPARDR